MEVSEKRERTVTYRKTKKNTGYPQFLESKGNTLQRQNMKKNLVKNSSTPRLPHVNANTFPRVKKGNGDGFAAERTTWNRQTSFSKEFSRQLSSTDIYPGSRRYHGRGRVMCPSKNRISFPLLSSVDRKILDSFGSYESASNLKRRDFFLSDSALAIRSIELKPRQTRVKEHTCQTPPKTSHDTKRSDPLFPSLTGKKNIEPLYSLSSPLFSLSDDGESLAPFLDGISLSPPPPSELSFSSPSPPQSPLYFSPSYDFLD